jgi:hypothetical protein
MMLLVVAGAALALAALPALLFRANLRLYHPPPPFPPAVEGRPLRAVSVLIPARNEERSIAAAVESALASKGVELEVLVLDDHSDDATADRVKEIARREPRVRLLAGAPLPPGWCGKQFACSQLALAASHPRLAFLDADVRLAPDALARAAVFLESSGAALVSGVPRQETGTLIERLVIPLIHFILLGFLPLARMRRSARPGYAAGCGQLFVTRRDAYDQAGGHAAIRASLHDGLTLPRAYRRAGLRTDLFDATAVASCRMYRGAGELWRGLAKNATEGLARPALIGPFTVLLLGGQVLPLAVLAWALLALEPWAIGLAAAATGLMYYPRLVSVGRFRQSMIGALLHPIGVLILLAVQWYALGRKLLGRAAGWKGRRY